jgi:ribosomal protein L39E
MFVDDKGNQRTYNPDFDIVMCNGVRYCVECKSEQFGFNETWIRYHNESQVKKKLLEDFCKENDMIPVWFTQKTRKDLYRKLKKEYVNSEEVL